MEFPIADKQQLQRQLDILRLFRYINEPTYFKDFVEIASSYSVESNIEAYTVSFEDSSMVIEGLMKKFLEPAGGEGVLLLLPSRVAS